MKPSRRILKQSLEFKLNFVVWTFAFSFFPFLSLQDTVPWFGRHLALIAATIAVCTLYSLWRLRRARPVRAAGFAGFGENGIKSPLLWFGVAYLAFGIIGFSSIRWVYSLPSEAALTPVSGTITQIGTCASAAHGRHAVIDLATAAGASARVVVPKIEFLACPGARERLARLKAGDELTAWIGRYPTDEELGEFVWALSSAGKTIISLDEMHAAHQRHFRKFQIWRSVVPTLGALMILWVVSLALRARRRCVAQTGASDLRGT